MTPRLRDRVDPWLTGAALGLVAVGVANLHALAATRPSLYAGLAGRQCLWALLGFGAAAWTYALARRDRHRPLGWLHAAALVGVALALAGFGGPVRGVHRWLRLGPLLVQPSEFLKLGVVTAVARWFGDVPIGSRSLVRTAAGVLALVTVPCLLVAAQPDLGTAVLLLAVGASTLCFTRDALRSLAVLALTTALPAAVGARSLLHDYQLRRVEAFLHPERNAAAAWQGLQARSALASGGWGGTDAWLAGHGLPDAHTDFALVAWGSARGALGVLLVLGLQAAVVARAFDTARRADDRYDLALTAGVGAMLLWQATVNAAMCLGVLPVVGVPLPLVSYGGSNLVTTLAALGVVLGVRARILATPPRPGAPGPERLYRGIAG